MRCVYLSAERLDPRVQAFRELHDPLGNLIPPHVTLVFPFDSAIGDEVLLDHVSRRCGSQGAIDASLAATPVLDHEYIYFPIASGAGRITALHNDLYTGPLSDFLRRDIPYVPHVTVGRMVSGDADELLQHAASRLSFEPAFRITTLRVERIAADGSGEAIGTIDLS